MTGPRSTLLSALAALFPLLAATGLAAQERVSQPLGAPPSPAPRAVSTAQAPTSAILLFSGRSPLHLEDADPSALSPSHLEGLRAAWVWSSPVPPRRVTAETLTGELSRLRDGEGPRGVVPLRVRVPEGVEDPEADLKVVAGPRALFEQVPEGWIPRWSLSADGRVEVPRLEGVPWRLRLVGRERGSGWLDVEGGEESAVLAPVAAGELRVAVTGPEGTPLPEAHLTMAENAHGTPRPTLWSRALADERGVVRFPALPVDLAATFVAGAPGHAPRVLWGRFTDLPAELALPAASVLRGRFVNEEDEPLAGVEVQAEGWLSDRVPFSFTREAKSAEDGSWELAALPPRRLVLLATREGYASFRRTLDLEEGRRLDLGEVALVRGAALRVWVRDGAGSAVPDASVRPGSGAGGATTDPRGRAELRDLPAASALELRVAAEGFLDAVAEVRPPWPEEATITLTRPLTVRGVFTDGDGRPVASGRVRVEWGDSFRFEELEGGDFELRLEPDVAHTLRFSSPLTARRSVEVQPGLPGETRDLGEITAPPGLVVRGTVLSAVDASPVTGARVWLPRPLPDPIRAWFLGDVLATRSDEMGRFVLGGLQAKPELLRVDAPGFARRHVEVHPEADVAEIDLGEVELSPGTAVRVRLPGPEEEVDGATARLDLRGDWRDLDMLSAAVVDGAAEWPHVPAGPALITVMAGRELLCEERLEVEPGDGGVEVVCEDERRPVTGVVLAGDRPAGPGTLVWRSGAEGGVKATIMDRRSRLGLRQQQVVGRGRPPVRVEVGDDGTFTAGGLSAGTWSVTWWPAGGDPAAPRRVEVPDGPEPRVAVRLTGGVVAGRVLDDEGVPVEGAWVRELEARGMARSRADGGFRITGLAPGPVRLQARQAELYSDVVEIGLEAGRVPDPVDLVLSADHAGRLAVQVWSEAGLPANGAFVFFDLGKRGIQVVSADGGGRAELTASLPSPPRARIAAFHDGRWAFGEWVPWDRFRAGVEQQIPATGELLVESEERRGAPALRAPHGWDLSLLLSLLGSHPTLAPDRPLLLTGLPEGLYRIGDDRTVSIRAGHRERLEIE